MLTVSALVCCGCQANDDAQAAAQQMAAASATLGAYYSALDQLTAAQEQAQQAQQYLNQVPAADVIAQLEDTRAQLRNRKQMADAVARLSALLSELAGSNAAKDSAAAAVALNSALVSLKAFSNNDREVSALNIAVTSVVNAVRAHDDVKAARSIAPAAQALSQFFDVEESYDVSLADSYYVVAASNAKLLIDGNQIAADSLYSSSLQPFDLTPRITDAALQANSHDDVKRRVDEALASRRKADQQAADDLSAALHTMADRLTTVAHDKPLHVRVPPFTLAGVKDWVSEVQADTGVKL